MRSFLLIFIATFTHTLTVANQQKVTSSPEHAIIYTRGATLFHQEKINFLQGYQEVVIEGLTNELDIHSLQVRVPKDVIIQSATFRQNHVTPLQVSQRIRELTDSIEVLETAIQLHNNRLETFKQEEKLILSNTNTGSHQSGVDPQKLRELARYYNERLLEIKNEITMLQFEDAKKKEKLAALKRQLNEQSRHRQRASGEVILQVTSARNVANAPVEFSYRVHNAGWVPSYDLRAVDNVQPVNLTYRAEVFQNTGLDWENIHLTISTGNPAIGATAPQLPPWFLQIPREYKIMRESAVELHRMPAPASDDYMDAETFGTGVDRHTTVHQTQLNVEYKIDLPYNISTGGNRKIIAMKQYELPATYVYQAIPKIDRDAFLLAGISGWDHLNLLPGTANIFFDNSYVGQARINPNVTTDTLKMSMGRDRQIIVEREQLRDFSKKAWLGNSVTNTFAYEITLRNNKQSAVTIDLKDQIPVSRNNEITVKLENKGGATYNDETGELNWKVNLQPGETRKIRFDFSVRHPKDQWIQGL